MNLKLRLAIGCLIATSAPLTSVTHAADLLEVYQRAQQSDPLLREADANRLASREVRPQAWAALGPQIDGSVTAQRTFTNTQGSLPRDSGLVDSSGNPIYTTGENNVIADPLSFGVTLRQSIFSWSKWAALDRAKAQVAQAEVTYQAAEQDLVFRVAQRYFNVLAAKDTLDANNAAAEAFGRQLEQFEKRFEVGLIAITDVQDARAERDRTVADVISAKRNLATTQELLRELTGEPVGELEAPDDDMPLKTPDPASEERWVSSAMENNLNLIATRLSADIADANVSVARAGHLPSLDLTVSRSDSESDSATRATLTTGVARGASSSERVVDTVQLQLVVPLFASGAT
ncbi:MAG: TolC family protein, partial [Candidatus Obscuribacterales bacterium]|nr:TolC family protein [Steroidobacteraceae bacterium]